MRQPTFSRGRRHRRQQRLLRTGIAIVLLIAVASLVGNLLGGDEPPPEPTPNVAFTGSARGQSDGTAPATAATRAEATEINAVLNDWYQRAFVDPSLYGDGTFPEVRARFAEASQASFTKEIDSLTIGDAREEVEFVRPEKSTANLTIFFAKGKEARFAVATVTFQARARMKDDDALPLRIVQRATYHLEKVSGSWVVTWFDARETQDSIQPPPSPSASS
ncbi:MAG: hypothetical protein WDA27_10925 [Actinomycetota bacterium]